MCNCLPDLSTLSSPKAAKPSRRSPGLSHMLLFAGLLLQPMGALAQVEAPNRPVVETTVQPGTVQCPKHWDKLLNLSKKNAEKKLAQVVSKYGLDPGCMKEKHSLHNIQASLSQSLTKDRQAVEVSAGKTAANTAKKPSWFYSSRKLMAEAWDSILNLVSAPDVNLVPKAHAQELPKRTLILYDYRPTEAFGKLGQIYAIMASNLAGHFTTDITVLDISDYASGDVDGYDVTIYIGAYYDNSIPSTFLADITQTDRTVVWLGSNLWKLAWDANYDFGANFGLAFDGLVGMNAAPTAENPEPGFYDTVLYKGLTFPKFYDYDGSTGTILAAPDIGVTRVIDAAKAEVLVRIENSTTGKQQPYVVRADNFWYVADVPLSYIGPRDRYLIFSDILYDIFNETPSDISPKAMVRLEDVNALNSLDSLKSLADFFYSRAIPFSMAVIPYYLDSLGIYNDGKPQRIRLDRPSSSTLRSGLDYSLVRGGAILMHGYTHQYGKKINPWNAVSGNDFEFWDIVNQKELEGLSTEEKVLSRIDKGIAMFSAAGYSPFAWETPHYHASAIASRAFTKRFDRTYQRVVYYTADRPDFDNGDYWAGQFFPYVIKQDYYGQMIIPENLGNIEYDIRDIDPTSTVTYTWQDLLENAKYAKVVRGGYGSFFFHPFWLEPELGTPGMADLERLVEGMTDLGYTWVGAETIEAAMGL